MKRNIPHRFRPTLAIIAALSAAFAGISQAVNLPPKPSLAIDGGHVVVNDDDADHNQEWDKDKNPTPDEGLSGPKTPEQSEPKLQKFTFTAMHTSEPGTLVITASSNANIKLWEDAAKTSPFTAASSYPVGISDDVTVVFYVEGLTPTAAFDSIVFSASFTVGQKTAVGEIKFGVTQADIDIDSDNDAQLAATFTDNDDKLEFSDKAEHPGKILLESTATIDANGVAVSVMQSAFAPLRVTLHPPFSSSTAKVKFSYPASVPSTPANKRGLRLWKANGNGSVFIAPSQEIPWNDIAVSGATDATLYVEYVEIPGSTKTYSKEDILITVTDPEGAKKGQIKILSNTTPLTGKESPDGLCVSLLPVEVESMDRYLSGSIPESLIDAFGGESKFGLVFRNPTSGETYSFNKLSEAYIYDDPFGATEEDEDKFLSNSEIAAWANGPSSASKELTQDVVFYRKDGKLHFRTLFDQAGAIEIGLIKDGQEIGKVDWTLTPDAEIADLLETVDSILSGNHDDDGGVILAAMNAGVSGEDLEVMREVAASAQSSGSSFSGFLRRNLTIKVNIPTWEALKDNFEQGVRKAGAAVDRAITVATFAGKGFCEGAWFAVKDDATSLVELGKMILNPAETAKTFYEGFKVLIDLDLQGWKNVGKTLVESFLKTGNEGVGEWSEPNSLDVASYLVGFTAGYITEQIVVTYVTAGILKAGNVGAKIGKFIRDASKGLKTALATVTQPAKILYQNALKAKNSIFRRFSQDVAGIADVKALKRMVHEMTLPCPVP